MRVLPLLLVLLLAWCAASWSAPVGTTFSYQGQLKKDGSPYHGTADFQFSIWDAASGGIQFGSTLSNLGLDVADGVFATDLDFGTGIFGGDARFLEVRVKVPGDADYTTLTPRQPIRPAPYALHALSGQGGGGSGPWVQDGADVTYPGGGVGVTGASSPFASGKGVFLEGGNASRAHIFGFDYDSWLPVDLILNAPGGNVGIGTSSPNAKLRIDSGTTATNPLRVSNNAANFATIYCQNLAANGYGFYDDRSWRHYMWGYLGINTLSPATSLHVVNTEAIRGESQGGVISGGLVRAGVHGIGGGNIVDGFAAGMVAESVGSNGIEAVTSKNTAYGGYFKNLAGGAALFADGVAKVKTLQIIGGADLAERFATREQAEPGTVMMIDPEAVGRMRVADQAYCHRVAGVVSGANDLNAGVELGLHPEDAETLPIALTGRVWVKCDAASAPIAPGDLLTTSSTPGHAMRASDPARAHGAILGKAMSSLETGTGMVLVLVSLQ